MLKIVDWSNTYRYEKVNNLYVLKSDVYLDFSYDAHIFRITVGKGAITDGLSVPRIFRLYLPCWDDNNLLYNIAGIIHDGLYGSEVLSKAFADELFYQSLLTAGISKFKANTAKWAVEHLAGLRYGRKNDDFGIAPYVYLECIK